MMQSNRLNQRMKQFGVDFTESERAIGEYLLRQGARTAFGPAALLSRDIGVSEATLVRFSRKVGYESYTEMQKDVQSELEERLSARPLARLADMARNVSPHWSALEKVVRTDMENLERILSYCSPEDFESALKLILGARTIYVFGMRAAARVASFLGYSLNLLIPNVRVVTNGADDQLDSFFSAGPEDVLIAVGVSRNTRSAHNVLDFAKGRGMKIVSITDGPASPFARRSDVILLVECDSPALLVSFTGVMCVAQAIVTAVGAAREKAAGERVKQLEEILEGYLAAE